jgi:peptidoglycan/LPS O-acetylase OafA/YrhL
VVWLLAANRRALLGFSLFVALASFAGRVVASLHGVSPLVTTVLTPFQLDALAIGGFLAVYLRQPGGDVAARRAIVPLVAAGTGLLLLQFGVRHFTQAGNAVLALRSGAFHLLFAALLLKALDSDTASHWGRFFLSKPMATLGKYSYGLYVYHHFLSYYFISHGTDLALAAIVGSHMAALALQAVGGIGVSMGIAWLSYEYFEKPFLRLKRFWPSVRDAHGTGA